MLTRFLATIFFFALAFARADADQRVTWYFAENQTSNKANLLQRDVRLSLGTDLYAIFGQNGYANLAIVPTSGLYVAVEPANPNVNGAVYQLIPDDANAWGGGPIGGAPLPADPTNVMVAGLVPNASANLGPLPVPVISGQSLISLVECQVSTIDATPTNTTFTTPGVGQTTAAVNRDRVDAVSCQLKAGTASSSAVAPTVDAGYVAVGTIAVPYGTATITGGMVSMLAVIAPSNVSLYPSQLVAPGNSSQATLPGSQPYAFPAGLTTTSLSVGSLNGCLSASSGVVSAGSCLNSVTAGSNIAVGTGSSPTIAVTAAPSFAGLTIGNLNGCLNATSGVVGSQTCGTVTGLTAGSNIVAGTGATPSVAVTAAPSFTSVAATNLTTGQCLTVNASQQIISTGSACGTGSGTLTTVSSGNSLISTSSAGGVVTITATAAPVLSGLTIGALNGCLNATSGVVGSTTCGTVTGLTAGSNVVIPSGGATPTVAVTNAPTFSGPVSASQFNGSGAGLTSIPNTSLVTLPVTSLTCSANVTCGTGATPSVAVTAAPSFTSVVGGNLTDSALTSGRCVQATTSGLLSNAAAGCVTSVAAGGSGNVVVGGTASAPTVDVTAAPSFSSVSTATLSASGAFYQGPASPTNNVTNSAAQIFESLAAYALSATSSSSVAATAYNFYNNGSSPSYSGSVLNYYGTTFGGTVAGLPFANLGQLRFQNVAAAMISTNGTAAITIAPTENAAYATTFGTNGSITMGGALSGATTGTFSGAVSVSGGHVAPFYQLSGADVGPTYHGVRVTGTTSAATATCGPFSSAYCATITLPTGTAAFSSATTTSTSFDCGEGNSLGANLYWTHDFATFVAEWNSATTIYVSGSTPSQAFAFDCKGT